MAFDPSRSVVPIVEIDESRNHKQLLGTGFIANHGGLVVTAKHVLEGIGGSGGGHAAAVFPDSDHKFSVRFLQDIRYPDNADVAIAKLRRFDDLVPLPFLFEPVGCVASVLTFEYSSTEVRMLENGKKEVVFRPHTLKGNVVSHYVSEWPKTMGLRCFDTSFPALQGASVAPVLRASDLTVVGMLVANVERHLMPAQVIRVADGADSYEEIKYFMPFGHAIGGREVARVIHAFGEAGLAPKPKE
jgi:hypothetical protein